MPKLSLSIHSAFSFNPLTGDLFLGITHNSDTLLKIKARNFTAAHAIERIDFEGEKKKHTPETVICPTGDINIDEAILEAEEVNTMDIELDHNIDLSFLKLLKQVGLYLLRKLSVQGKIEQAVIDALKSESDTEKEPLIQTLKTIRQFIPKHFVKTQQYHGDVNLGSPSYPRYPSFLKSNNFITYLSYLFPKVSPNRIQLKLFSAEDMVLFLAPKALGYKKRTPLSSFSCFSKGIFLEIRNKSHVLIFDSVQGMLLRVPKRQQVLPLIVHQEEERTGDDKQTVGETIESGAIGYKRETIISEKTQNLYDLPLSSVTRDMFLSYKPQASSENKYKPEEYHYKS